MLLLNHSRFGVYLHFIYPNELGVKDTTDTDKSASYLDLHLEIGDGNKTIRQTGWLFFSNSQLPFISTNIPTSPAYEVFISQLIRYSRASAQCSDILDRAQQPTQKLLKQGNVPPRFESSLLQFYSRHHNLNYRYEIPISQMKINLFLFPLSVARLLQGLTAYMSNAGGCLIRSRNGLPFANT
jgi:hypothetical protein